MEDHELKHLWRLASENESIHIKKNDLMTQLEKDLNYMDKKIWQRDLGEIGASFIIIPFFAYLIFTIPSMLSKIGSGFMVAFAIILIYQTLRVKRLRKIDFTNSIKAQLNQTKKYIQEQINLLETVLYWYILPPYIGCFLFVSGISKNTLVTIIIMVFATAGCVFVYYLNQKAAKVNLKTILNDVEKAIAELEDL